MTHPIEQAADAVDRELADLRANLAQSAAGNNGLVELVKATQENNETLRAKLAVGGVLHLATDWEPYAQQMMEVLSAAPGWRNRFGAGAWATEHDRPTTKFEQRGERLGHGVWDLMFERTA